MNTTTHPDGTSALNLVNGEWLSGEREPLRDPGDLGTTVGHVHQADGQVVSRVITAVEDAAHGWAATPFEDRLRMLSEAKGDLERASSEGLWAELLTLEQGKVLKESNIEVGGVPAMIDAFGAIARMALEPDITVDHLGRREVTHEPVGPVVAVTPWNWPVLLSLSKVLPSVLAGNPTILKPAPNTPLVVTAIVSTLAKALPPGVLNVVHGGGAVGAELVTHPSVRKVVFTGSTENGKRVYEGGAATVKNLTLELGGNDPAIVLSDVDVSDQTAQSIIASAFITAGQVCWAIKRLYVHRTRFAELQEALAAELEKVVVGHGLDPAVTMGPLNNGLQFERVERMKESAARSGAVVTSFGKLQGGLDGYYSRPALVTGINEEHALVREEQFGPIMPMIPFDDIDAVIGAANSSPYGLCASVWSQDVPHAFDVARQLSAGQVFVNTHAGGALDRTQGIGGVRQSGIGREYGVEGVRQYTEQRVLSDRVVRPPA